MGHDRLVNDPAGTGESNGGAAERRASLAAIATSATVFALLLLAVPAFFLSFDEAKYIGIGNNIFDGLGPRTPFGGYFLSHAPVWSATLVLPQAILGINPLDTGHVLNALAGIGVVVLAGVLGWRVRPAVGGLAAAGTIAITYIHDLTRTARLDVPVAFLILLYLLVTFRAVRNERVGWAIGAGLLFALAFEVKEIALPFAPVPILAGILWGRPWRALARTAGWLILAASLGLSWWFLLVARLGGTVYRLGTPAWTLGPIAAVVIGSAVGMILAARMADRPRIAGLGLRLNLAGGQTGRARSGRPALVGVAVVLWCAGLFVVFARELGIRGTQILDVRQIALYSTTWLPGVLKVAAAVGAVGAALSIWAWRSAPAATRSAIGDLWLATICGAPLILLVVEVGEPPRNYIAQLAILAALAGAGWLWLIETLVVRWRARGRLAGERPTGFRPRLGVASIVLLAAVLGAGGLLSVHALTFREMRSGRALASAVTTTVGWLRANLPPGATVAFGSFLGYEISLGLRGHNPTAQVRHIVVIGDPTAPDAIRIAGQPVADDWVAIDVAPRNVNEFQAFSASRLSHDIRASGASYWVYATQTATSAPTIVPALAGAGGIRELMQWTWPTSTIPIAVHVYAIDPAGVSFPGNRLIVSPEALDRLVSGLEAAGPAGRATAGTLAGIIEVSPASPTTAALLDRLRRVAGH